MNFLSFENFEFITCNFDSLVKSSTDGVRRKCPWGAKQSAAGGSYTPAKNQRDKKAQWVFRDEAIHVVC